MQTTKNKSNGLTINATKPVPRILITNTASKKWKGCIYFSTSDMTGQVLMFLKNAPLQYSGTFFKNPIFVHTASCRHKLENIIKKEAMCLIKKHCLS